MASELRRTERRQAEAIESWEGIVFLVSHRTRTGDARWSVGVELGTLPRCRVSFDRPRQARRAFREVIKRLADRLELEIVDTLGGYGLELRRVKTRRTSGELARVAEGRRRH
jgi:hypothetical protein